LLAGTFPTWPSLGRLSFTNMLVPVSPPFPTSTEHYPVFLTLANLMENTISKFSVSFVGLLVMGTVFSFLILQLFVPFSLFLEE
jgi:hypothetical protein